MNSRHQTAFVLGWIRTSWSVAVLIVLLGTFLPIFEGRTEIASHSSRGSDNAQFASQVTAVGDFTIASMGISFSRMIRDIRTHWGRISSGAVRVRTDRSVCDELDMVNRMRVGELDAAVLTSAGLLEIAPEIWALQMPMMFRSDGELNHVRDRISPRLEAKFEERGFVLVAWVHLGWVTFFSYFKPVTHPYDLNPRTLVIPLAGTTHSCLDNRMIWAGPGICGVFHETLPRSANAIATTPYCAGSKFFIKDNFNLANRIRHMTELKWAPLMGALVVSKRAWTRIEKDLRPRFRGAAQSSSRRLQAYLLNLERRVIKRMQKKGVTVNPIPKSTVTKWKRHAREGYQRIVGTIVPSKLSAKIERILKEYRSHPL